MPTGPKKLLVALLSVLAAAAGARAVGTGNDLPDIGSPASSSLSLDDEYHIGLQVMRQLRDEGQIIEDPEATEYLQALGSRIVAQATGDSAQRFSFFFVRDNTINAFALPGGFIGVNYGLVLATRNEAQLAGVLAHEIAHVTQRHIARRVRSQGRQSIATMAAILAAILVGAATGSSDAALGGISDGAGRGHAAADQLHARQRERSRPRRHELPRRGGLRSLRHAGLLRDHGPAQRRSLATNRNALPEILQSHPVATNRIAESRARAAQFKDLKPTAESVSYALTRERLRVLATPAEDNVRRYYTDRREQQDQTVGERYGEALASYQARQFARLARLADRARARVSAGADAAVDARPGADERRAKPTKRSTRSAARSSFRRATSRSPCVTPKPC